MHPYNDGTEVGGSSSGIHLDVTFDSNYSIMNLHGEHLGSKERGVVFNTDPQLTPLRISGLSVSYFLKKKGLGIYIS